MHASPWCALPHKVDARLVLVCAFPPCIMEQAILAVFLFGIDELAITLEEPFSILPLEVLIAQLDELNAGMVAASGTARDAS
jgi:hypothetical protein